MENRIKEPSEKELKAIEKQRQRELSAVIAENNRKEEYELRPNCKVCDNGRLFYRVEVDWILVFLGMVALLIGAPVAFPGILTFFATLSVSAQDSIQVISAGYSLIGLLIMLFGLNLMCKKKQYLACDHCGAAVIACKVGTGYFIPKSKAGIVFFVYCVMAALILAYLIVINI